ncbi:MAG: helix-turn-helix domain-containing protein [Brumimicrobium sp.]
MRQESIKISHIYNKVNSKRNDGNYYAVCFFKTAVKSMVIDTRLHANVVKDTAILMKPYQNWKIVSKSNVHSGYVLYLSVGVMENPIFRKLGIAQALLDHTEKNPTATLSSCSAHRVYTILDMLDEFISSNRSFRDETIMSLLKTLFVYTDGTWNTTYTLRESNGKAALVHNFRKALDKFYAECHQVAGYAERLNISEKYLNECVKEVLQVNAKKLIVYTLIAHAQRALKFSDKTVKEISYDLGFTSPDYFSYFFKKHTGMTPTQLRKNL